MLQYNSIVYYSEFQSKLYYIYFIYMKGEILSKATVFWEKKGYLIYQICMVMSTQTRHNILSYIIVATDKTTVQRTLIGWISKSSTAYSMQFGEPMFTSSSLANLIWAKTKWCQANTARLFFHSTPAVCAEVNGITLRVKELVPVSGQEQEHKQEETAMHTVTAVDLLEVFALLCLVFYIWPNTIETQWWSDFIKRRESWK